MSATRELAGQLGYCEAITAGDDAQTTYFMALEIHAYLEELEREGWQFVPPEKQEEAP